jgi:hypothetical protein
MLEEISNLQSLEVLESRSSMVMCLDDITWGDMDTQDACHVSMCYDILKG